MPRVLSLLLTVGLILGAIPCSGSAVDATDAWQPVPVPGPSLPMPPRRWYRAWFTSHDSFFTPHERKLFAESVTLNLRGFSGVHEVVVNGVSVGRGGTFHPKYQDGVAGNHRHKIPPGLLKQGKWNGLFIRAYHPDARSSFQGEDLFVMDSFNEAILEGVRDWRPAESVGSPGSEATACTDPAPLGCLELGWFARRRRLRGGWC